MYVYSARSLDVGEHGGIGALGALGLRREEARALGHRELRQNRSQESLQTLVTDRQRGAKTEREQSKMKAQDLQLKLSKLHDMDQQLKEKSKSCDSGRLLVGEMINSHGMVARSMASGACTRRCWLK